MVHVNFGGRDLSVYDTLDFGGRDIPVGTLNQFGRPSSLTLRNLPNWHNFACEGEVNCMYIYALVTLMSNSGCKPEVQPVLL